MTFMLCSNVECPRACWCKRFTLHREIPKGRDYIEHPAGSGFSCYVKNKAREIWERDYPEGVIDE